jgi:hypothetical protein
MMGLKTTSVNSELFKVKDIKHPAIKASSELR